jgi:hypothetical protein
MGGFAWVVPVYRGGAQSGQWVVYTRGQSKSSWAESLPHAQSARSSVTAHSSPATYATAQPPAGRSAAGGHRYARPRTQKLVSLHAAQSACERSPAASPPCVPGAHNAGRPLPPRQKAPCGHCRHPSAAASRAAAENVPGWQGSGRVPLPGQ